MATLSFKILLARRKSSGKLGIYVSLTFKREVRYISTEFEIDDEFQFDDGKVCYRPDARIMNQRMQYVLNVYRQKLEVLDLRKYPDCAALKKALTAEEDTGCNITIKEMFLNRIKRLLSEKRDSYARMNEYTCKVVLESLGDAPVVYLNRSDIKKLYNDMVRKGYAPGNIQMRMTHFKAAINELIDDNSLKYEDHPFKGFKMPQSSIRLMDITPDQFQRIKNLNDFDNSKQKLGRDMFLLSFYLCGINLADLVMCDLSGNELNYIRRKSGDHKQGEKTTSFRICPEAREIISQYISPATGRLVLPGSCYSNTRRWVDKAFKALAERVGISQPNFSYYSARKTFAQFAFMSGVKTEVIEYCLGQTMKRNRPIFNYVRVMQVQADKAIRDVIRYAEEGESKTYSALA